jgi:alkylation response protein AidB-like acyl-CoA dehydrogenase
MDFALQWHQQELQGTARTFLAEAIDLDALRAAAAGEPGFSERTHRRMGEMGWLSLGGSAPGSDPADAVDLAVVYEELGRAAAPGPHMISGLVVPLLIQALRCGRTSQVEGLASGASITTLALYEEAGDEDPSATSTLARRDEEGWVLEGAKAFVPYASAADTIIVLARCETERGDLAFFEIPRNVAGLRIEPMEVLSGERQHVLLLSNVRIGHDSRLSSEDPAEALLAVAPMVTVAQSAELVGLSQRALEIAVEYSKDRVAFGHPIGSYQAIQHKCSDMLADVDASRFLVYQAACLVNSGAGTDYRVPIAKAFSAAAARRVTKEAHQILAGAGFVLDHRLNFYYRRVKGIEAAFGDVNHQLDLVADELLGVGGRP